MTDRYWAAYKCRCLYRQGFHRMTEKVPPVRIVRKDGPVIIRSLNGAQVNAEYDLWNDIVASEFFPPNVDSAFYVLSLEKSVTQAAEVRVIEAELVKAL